MDWCEIKANRFAALVTWAQLWQLWGRNCVQCVDGCRAGAGAECWDGSLLFLRPVRRGETRLVLAGQFQFSPDPASLRDGAIMLLSCLLLSALVRAGLANWNEWWTYDGISGPAYWGLINPAWTMCNKVCPTPSYQNSTSPRIWYKAM